MKLVSRAAWGATKTKPLPTNITPEFGGVAIHYVGGKGNLIPTPHTKCASLVRGIQKQHIHNNGWTDIAYSYLVCQHGYVFEGRGVHHRTAANGTPSGNQNYYAVCGLLNKDDSPTAQMLEAIADACKYLRQNGHAGDKVVGHRQLKNTDCPGPLYRFVQQGIFLRKKIQEDNTYPGHPISYGSTGPIVGKIQRQLNKLGANLTVDNDFGSRTEHAVETYQSSHRLKPDGIVGIKTWDSLF